MSEPLLPLDANRLQRETCFAQFYQAVHGRPPFAWQKRLAAEVLDPAKKWPDAIRVPTGCGKTSILEVAVFELAVQASRDPASVTAARRVCFVVDRKLIVDEATEHAARIRGNLMGAGGEDSILARVANALRSLTPHPDRPEQEPLRVVRLRGGVYRDDGWAADPLTPTLIVSTVDQVGSRLLFRGYGVSRRSRAVHAGLLAFDTRIILDEAHLSGVFATTIMGREPGGNGKGQRIAGIRPYQEWAERAVLPAHRRLRTTRMSATAGTAGDEEIAFELSKDERNEASIKPRLEAKKPAALIAVPVEAVNKSVREQQSRVAREIDRKNREKLVEAMVKHAEKVAGIDQAGVAGRPIVIGLVFNRVASARRAFEQLREHLGETAKADTVLLTGRIRAFDRDRLLDQLLPRIKAGREAQPDRPLFVVATQTVEVGANIDFDALVTEAAPLDALRQRFGRLHRLPNQPAARPPAAATVFIQSDHAEDSSTDSLYGPAVAETWKWLINNAKNKDAGKSKGKKAKKGSSDAPPSIDFRSDAMDSEVSELAPADLAKLVAPQPDAPILFPAHLDAWAQTSPQPDPDPDVAPFLHGPGSGSADVQVVWRADLIPRNREHWSKIVSLMPPRTREALALPLHEVRAWLRNLPSLEVWDVEGAAGSDADMQGRAWRALRWRGAGKSRVVGPEQLRPGDTIVVPASYGGADEFGWRGRGSANAEQPVTDVADQCLAELVASYPHNAFRRPPLRVRLHPALLGSDPAWSDESAKIRRTLSQAASAAANEGDPLDDVRQVLKAWPSLAAAGEDILGACQTLRDNAQRATIKPYPDGKGVVASANVLLTAQRSIPEHDLEINEPDDNSASILDGGQSVTLDAHTEAVEHMVAAFARACALSDDLRRVLESAAFWHDQGKRDRRFQAWLHGSELAAFAALAENPPRVLAKSARPDAARGRSSALFGYPRGHRHELVSVRLFEDAVKDASTADSPDSDLVKFLIGTHHGHGRAFAPVSRDHHPVQIKMDHQRRPIEVSSDHALHTLNSGWTDLFWSLICKYGWWGLAYLEAILITADRHVSGEEQRCVRCRDARSAPDQSSLPAAARVAVSSPTGSSTR